MSDKYAQRRQLRTQRSNSGFAVVFFSVAAFVFFCLTGGTAWLSGHGLMWLWWIFFAAFAVCLVCAGSAFYHYSMAGFDLQDLNRRR